MTEKVRLVIWDLDETFWRGTLSEGGVTAYVQEHHDAVIELARRGIMSSICSKNDLAPVRALLQQHGIWDYFIFPSVDWSAKGGRVEALIETVQLRAPTVMFIDDNPGNRAEVAARVAGVQVEDEHFIGRLLDDPRFAGKDDRELSRLNQYKLLEQRQGDAAQAGGDNLAFLRGCDVRVVIETDIEPHIDRAVELINRTNQLNFTKRRLPEEPEAARAELRALLSHWWARAGLVRVIDRYGDYGICGLYVVSGGAGGAAPTAMHFCFSCRALGMGVEQFIYARLGRPEIKVRGQVVSDLAEPALVDWIRVADARDEVLGADEPSAGGLTEIRLLGGCEMDVLGHYFGLAAPRVVRESNLTRGPLFVRKDSSALTRVALSDGFNPSPFLALGYGGEDFTSSFLAPALPGTWLVLAVWGDVYINLYEHVVTGIKLPVFLFGLYSDLCAMSDAEIAACIGGQGAKPEFADEINRVVGVLRREFRFRGGIKLAESETNLRWMLEHLPDQARLLLWLPSAFNSAGVARGGAQLFNQMMRRVAAEFPAVRVVGMDEVVTPDRERQGKFDHFERQVYFRVYRRMMEVMAGGRARPTSELLTDEGTEPK